MELLVVLRLLVVKVVLLVFQPYHLLVVGVVEMVTMYLGLVETVVQVVDLINNQRVVMETFLQLVHLKEIQVVQELDQEVLVVAVLVLQETQVVVELVVQMVETVLL